MGKTASRFYKRELPDLALSVERSTEAVPDDGNFHIVNDGRVLASFKSEARAVATFRAIARDMGFRPRSTATQSASVFEEDLDKHFHEKELYWADSDKHRRVGGKGR